MAEPLAEITDYAQLVEALRARVDAQHIVISRIDDVTGLSDGRTRQLLDPRGRKKFDDLTLGPVLGALGVKLILVEDPATARYLARVERKQRA